MASPEFDQQPQEIVLKPKLFGKEFNIPLENNESAKFINKLLSMDTAQALRLALFLGLPPLVALTIYLRAHARRSNGRTAEEIIPISSQQQESFANLWSKTYHNALGLVVNKIGMVRVIDAQDIVANTYFSWFSEHWGRGRNYDAKPASEQEDMFIKSLINRTSNWRRDNFRRKDKVYLEELTDDFEWDTPTGEAIEDEIIDKLSPDEETEELHQAIADYLEKFDRRRKIVAFLKAGGMEYRDIGEILGATNDAIKLIWFRVCLSLRKAVKNIIKPVGGKSVF